MDVRPLSRSRSPRSRSPRSRPLSRERSLPRRSLSRLRERERLRDLERSRRGERSRLGDLAGLRAGLRAGLFFSASVVSAGASSAAISTSRVSGSPNWRSSRGDPSALILELGWETGEKRKGGDGTAARPPICPRFCGRLLKKQTVKNRLRMKRSKAGAPSRKEGSYFRHRSTVPSGR